MKTDRRDFIRIGVTGTGLIAGGITSFNGIEQAPPAEKAHKQHFNMCGYAAPKLDTVRIGIIGIGNRGLAAVDRL